MPFVIVEKDDDVGGTWLENTYPGCRVDNPNHNYSYSFAQRHDWPLHFSTQDVLLDYFRRCADAFGLRDHIRFGTEVRVGHVVGHRPALDGARHATPTAREETLDANAVVSAVGQLNRPLAPRHRRPRLVRRAGVPLGARGTTTSTSAASASR